PKRQPGLTLARPTLSLARRRTTVASNELSAASADALEKIDQLVAATRTPFSGAPVEPDKVAELERSLRALEERLAERERVFAELEGRLFERERELAEMEALLQAREKVVDAARRGARADAGVSPEEKAAL